MLSKIASMPLGISLLLSAGTPAVAAVSPPTHPCSGILAPTERLACYDHAFPPVHSAQAEAVAQARIFGLPPRQSGEDASRVRHIASHVVTVGTDRDGERVFTLNNGQVWRQTESSVLGLARPGDAITIRAGSFGSYLLITPGGVPLRVKRIR